MVRITGHKNIAGMSQSLLSQGMALTPLDFPKDYKFQGVARIF